MPFKIVRTSEPNGDRLSIVPSLWEYNGILCWPPNNKNILKLIKDERSKPSTDWKKMNCDVKRSNLFSYAQAEIELESMERHSETDVNELQCQETADPTPHNIQTQMVDHIDTMNFDAYADALTNTNSIPRNITNTSINSMLNTGEVVLQVYDDRNMISDKIDTMVNIINNQNKIIQNMVNKICIMSVQLEDISEKLNQPRNEQPVQVTLLKDARRDESESFCFNIIENQSQFDALEVKLADKSEYKKLKKLFSFLCSPSTGDGKTFAYRLLDTLLSRDFISLCSWSGGSRGEKSKIALKNYKLFMKFFFEMVHSWDAAFTLEASEDFFKTVVKNSGKRKLMRDLRASKTKRRKNKNTAKINNNPSTKQGENNIEQNTLETEDKQEVRDGVYRIWREIENISNNGPPENDHNDEGLLC